MCSKCAGQLIFWQLALGGFLRKRSLNAILLLSLAVAPGFATALFQGSLAADNQVALFNFTANTSEAIVIETYSYAGGTVNATVIPGGFAPTAFLFDNLGNVLTLINGTCGQGARPDHLELRRPLFPGHIGAVGHVHFGAGRGR